MRSELSTPHFGPHAVETYGTVMGTVILTSRHLLQSTFSL